MPPEIELSTFVDYVATSLELNLIYDRSVLSKKVSLTFAHPIPMESLPGLLRSVLKTHGFALVPAEQAGWHRIIALQIADPGTALRELDSEVPGAQVISYVLPCRHVELTRLQSTIEPLLTEPGGSILVIPEGNLLVITDFAQNVRRILEMAALIDGPQSIPSVTRIPVRNADPAELAELVTRVMVEQLRLGPTGSASLPVSLQVDPASGDLLAIGGAAYANRARALCEEFDLKVERSTQVYHAEFVSTSRVRRLAEEFVGGLPMRIVSDDETNALIVTATTDQHRAIGQLMVRFDVAPAAAASPMRFYQLMNRRADDVFASLAGLLGEPNIQDSPPAPREDPVARPELSSRGQDQAVQPIQALTAVQGEGFSMSLDEHTNSIILVATPEVHRQVSELIRRLDQRRPQVLVEVTLVSISADESLNLGVELQGLDLGDPWDYLLFSSFGLSGITPATGQRMLNVLPGGTGVLLAPDEVPLIVQALQTHGKTQVYSAPRLLVDDNATGRLESVAESPFTSVNASDTVATTSFAGFAKAGTQLTITPHIAEGDHVEIEYDITVSSFTGAGDGSVPPPRSSDTISSTVRVPDSYTVVVGGLLTETLGESESEIPGLGDVPILEFLAGTRSKSKSKVRLYAFIRPTVMRDEMFEDLKYISKEDLEAANVDDGFPPDRIQFMK